MITDTFGKCPIIQERMSTKLFGLRLTAQYRRG